VAGIVLALWVLAVALEAFIQAGLILPPLSVALEFLPGLLGLAVLFAAGFNAGEVYLRPRPFSRRGLLLLLAPLPLLAPVYLTGRWAGWNRLSLLFYAPAGALAQVLFFRCALLPVCLRSLPGRPVLAVLLAALLHGFWHIGPLVQGAAWYAALPVMLVPFVASVLWNLQVRLDRTVLWAAALHILVDQGLSLFAYG